MGHILSKLSKYLGIKVALSTTEAKYIAMFMALCDVIPIMALAHEMKDHNFDIICTQPHIYCKVFEDNSGALELACLPKQSVLSPFLQFCVQRAN